MTQATIPFLDLVSPHRELEEELIAACRSAIRSAHFIGGTEVESFEREFAEYCGARYCVGLGSGTDAVRFALMASGVRPGDAVITVPHTFIATVEGISQAGAGTEFVDVDDRTYNMSADALEQYLNACKVDPTGRPLGQRTGKPIRAIVPVHIYGQVADMDAITTIADRYGLVVVEDACQAQGAEYTNGGAVRRAGTFGRAAAFSFYPGKNLGACGEAGAVTTNDEAVAKYIRMIRDHGQAQKYYHDIEGYNGRLDAIQAAFLRVKLKHLDKWNSQRRAAAARYNELLGPAASSGALVIPYEPEWSQAIYHLYVIRTADRDSLAQHLKAANIQTGLHYPVPLHQQKCYAEWGYKTGSFPATERIAAEIISLPMFPGISDAQQERVAQGVESFVRIATPAR
jgi:dTDP-4-amino-4,6-dideoxygalactose transaminase